MKNRGTRGRRRIFVYGSLLAGEPHHGVLGGAELLGAAHTTSAWLLLDLGEYPGLVRRTAQCSTGDSEAQLGVRGEVYEVDAETLSRLDALEEHPTLYRREPLTLADGTSAETYVWQAPLGSATVVVASGDWRARRARRSAR